MAYKKWEPIILTFKISQSEADKFDKIKKETGLKSDNQVLRMLMYLFEDCKWRK